MSKQNQYEFNRFHLSKIKSGCGNLELASVHYKVQST